MHTQLFVLTALGSLVLSFSWVIWLSLQCWQHQQLCQLYSFSSSRLALSITVTSGSPSPWRYLCQTQVPCHSMLLQGERWQRKDGFVACVYDQEVVTLPCVHTTGSWWNIVLSEEVPFHGTSSAVIELEPASHTYCLPNATRMPPTN